MNGIRWDESVLPVSGKGGGEEGWESRFGCVSERS